MLSLQVCKSYLRNSKYSDEEIREIQNFLYALSCKVIKQTIKQYDLKQTTTRKSE